MELNTPNTTATDARKRYWKKMVMHQKKIESMKNPKFTYFDFLDYIPEIPEELITYDVKNILKDTKEYSDPNTKYVTYSNKLNSKYKTIDVSVKIYEFLKPYFGDDFQIRYQVMRTQLPIHIDDHMLQARPFVFNYVLLPGGHNVKTRHWKLPNHIKDPNDNSLDSLLWGEKQDKKQLLHEVVIPPKRWHRLQVDIPHDISKIDTPRLGITVFENK